VQPDDGFWDQISVEPTPTQAQQALAEAEAQKQQPLTGNKAVAYVIDQVSRGASAVEIRHGLITSGTSEAEADRALDTIVDHKRSRKSGRSGGMAAGAKHLMVGGLVCLVGIGITVGSYMLTEPGGYFMLAWGPIVFGGMEAFYGIVMLLGGGGGGDD